MYLRETRRASKDGTVVSCLQLAHNERHPRTGSPVAKVIHNFGRSGKVHRQALARLVASISRFLDPEQAVAAAGAKVEVTGLAGDLGGAWVLGGCGNRLEIATAIRKAAAGRRLDGETTERVIFALVATGRWNPPPSWPPPGGVAERAAAGVCGVQRGCPPTRRWTSCWTRWAGSPPRSSPRSPTCSTPAWNIVFVDTSSACWEGSVADELAELAGQAADDEERAGGERRAGARALRGPPR